MLTSEMIVAKANEVRRELDGTMEPIERLIADNDLVFAIWQDRAEREGIATQIIKGHALLAEIVASGQPQQVRWTAIPTNDAEQAAALAMVLGEKHH